MFKIHLRKPEGCWDHCFVYVRLTNAMTPMDILLSKFIISEFDPPMPPDHAQVQGRFAGVYYIVYWYLGRSSDFSA